MIPVPEEILKVFRQAYAGSPSAVLARFGGGFDDSDGTVYRLGDLADERLLKVLHYGQGETRGALLHLTARLQFIDYLSRHGVPVIEPLTSLKNNLYEVVEDNNGCWVAYAMKKVQGQTMSAKVWEPDFVHRWGQVMGKLHRVTQAYPDWHHCTDPENGKPYLTWESEWAAFHDKIKDPDIKARWEDIGVRLCGLPVCRECFGFIHNDPHLWNLRVDGDRVTLLDFDVATHHWFANDIAISCQHVLTMLSGGLSLPLHHPERLEQFLKVFLKGYFRENELDKAWLPQLEVFFAYRRILSFTFMNDWYKARPERVLIWKEMIMAQPPLLAGMSL